jgi:hypothetical protein
MEVQGEPMKALARPAGLVFKQIRHYFCHAYVLPIKPRVKSFKDEPINSHGLVDGC